jgi:putative iron-only hydrogenase system regulator
MEEGEMIRRVALVSIIVSDTAQTAKLNEYLHEASDYIIGRMGIPYRQRKISIISVALDAPQDLISALSGKIGKLEGVSSRTTYSDVITEE